MEVISKRSKPETIYGKFSLNWIVLVYIPIIILTPFYTYYMCVIKNKECRAGHSTITQTANHYPQNTYFRFVMGIGATILVLCFNTIFRWVNVQAQKAGFPTMGKTLYYCVMAALVCYCIAVETIDGKGNGPLHTPSAALFFLTFQITIIQTTLYLYRLREWDSSVISSRSMNIKIVLAIYVSAVWVYCLYKILSQNENGADFTVVLEWNAYLIDLLYVLSYAQQWKRIKLCLIKT